MNTQISNEERARIFAAYWGCEFGWILRNDKELDRREIYTICGVTAHTIHGSADRANHFPIQDCKLILSPLSEISDADAIEIAKLFGGTKTKVDGNFLQVYKDDGMVTFYLVFGAQSAIPAKLIDYLRQKGYDMGYGAIDSLITAGIAVQTTKDR